jgi:hypothetical protein
VLPERLRGWDSKAGHLSGTYIHPLHPRTTRLLRYTAGRGHALWKAGSVLHCDCDEEARPRSGYRPGAPGGRQVEPVDEHLRAPAWMGASPLPPAWCRVTNLHACRDHHSRDRGWRDRVHRTTSQSRLTVDKAQRRTPHDRMTPLTLANVDALRAPTYDSISLPSGRTTAFAGHFRNVYPVGQGSAIGQTTSTAKGQGTG